MKKQKRPNLKSEAGQSILEFALTLMLMMAFVMYFVDLGLLFGVSNYVHYATFMSARAYMAAGATQQDQTTRAHDVLVQMLKRSSDQSGADKYSFIMKGTGGGDVPGFGLNSPLFDKSTPDFSWLQGVRYTFRSRIFVLPLAGRAEPTQSNVPGQSVNSVTLTSESWLGREPTDTECQSQMKANWIYDNGC